MVFLWILLCKLIQFHICSNRALKFLTLSLLHAARVLSLRESLIVCGVRGPAWPVSARGSMPLNDDRVASRPLARLLGLFFLGLWVLGTFALVLVGWTSCGAYNPKQNANYLSKSDCYTFQLKCIFWSECLVSLVKTHELPWAYKTH